jgi:glycosyltransferase involved in cell wall biosynthesis
MDVTTIVATFGNQRVWLPRAEQAAASVDHGEVIRYHGKTLAIARNYAAAKATTEWLCFLDADDSLTPGYMDAMAKATGDLRAPAISLVTGKTVTDPITLHDRDIEELNPCVIGTLIRRELFIDLGGFKEWRAWEDWCLFLRAHRSGATIEHVPNAVYRVTVRPGSRNNTVKDGKRLHAQIKAEA